MRKIRLELHGTLHAKRATVATLRKKKKKKKKGKEAFGGCFFVDLLSKNDFREPVEYALMW